ncbi:MAG TPA: glycosyltransferase family 4 protein [Pseudolabrys sp.]|nr:glycosyltransferase family 4 protein [Pseudolabrys sp.]
MKILHIFRAPVGGLFRHVIDLASGQIARGHEVGIVADSLTGNARSDEILFALAPKLSLGLTRVAMHRQPSPLDVLSLAHITARARRAGAQVVHGHGAKGGALARLAPVRTVAVRAYTPHGGSLHSSVGGKLHLLLERCLMQRGNLYLFESAYAHEAFLGKVGQPRGIVRVVHNGVGVQEFAPIADNADATDLVFLGELRWLKGVDVLIDTLAGLHANGRKLTLTIVGDGPDAQAFRDQVSRLGLAGAVRFRAPMPARAAFAMGRIMVAPSRAESLPYVVLEAIAAGKSIVTTKVGGIPEIFGECTDRLVAPGDTAALAQAIVRLCDDLDAAVGLSRTLQARVRSAFSIDLMVDQVLSAYETVIDAAHLGGQRTSDALVADRNAPRCA